MRNQSPAFRDESQDNGRLDDRDASIGLLDLIRGIGNGCRNFDTRLTLIDGLPYERLRQTEAKGVVSAAVRAAVLHGKLGDANINGVQRKMDRGVVERLSKEVVCLERPCQSLARQVIRVSGVDGDFELRKNLLRDLHLLLRGIVSGNRSQRKRAHIHFVSKLKVVGSHAKRRQCLM